MFLIMLWNFSLGYALHSRASRTRMPLWGQGAEQDSGGGRRVVVRTCQAGKELPVVFLQGAKCEKQSLHPKQTLTELEQ